MKILLIGANGTVGTVLQEGLMGFEVTPVDLPELDVRNYRSLVQKMRDHDVVIHLAWAVHPTKAPDSLALDNIKMAHNVFEAAKETGVRRLIMASSVHADNFYDWDTEKDGFLSVEKTPAPISPYGASKVFVENLGAVHASRQELEVVCLRLGAVRPGDLKPEDFYEQAVWLRHRDLVSAVKKCLIVRHIPQRFTVFYAVSENKNRIHDFSNSVKWQPARSRRLTWPAVEIVLPELELEVA